MSRRGVSWDVSVPRFLLGRSVGSLSDAVLFGKTSSLRLRHLDPLRLPNQHWVRLQPILSGICGTDIGNLRFQSAPTLQPFASFPAILGHEILARVIEPGDRVSKVVPGQRVAVDPSISCRVRGYPDANLCAACNMGRAARCQRAGEVGPLLVDGRPVAPGMMIGYHRDLPGGWGDEILAHESQLYPVDDALDDRTSVLIEPLSISVHAVLSLKPSASARVLVIGSGPVALATIWALRALGHAGPITAQVKRPREAELARAMGADECVTPGSQARDAMQATGARAYQPSLGPEVWAGGGYSVVFDCVGKRASIEQSLRFVAAGGSIVLLGCAGEIRSLDLTLLWARELSLVGFVGYGLEEWQGRQLHTFEVTHELLKETRAPLADMVEVVPLEDYTRALGLAAHRAQSGASKVALRPR